LVFEVLREIFIRTDSVDKVLASFQVVWLSTLVEFVL